MDLGAEVLHSGTLANHLPTTDARQHQAEFATVLCDASYVQHHRKARLHDDRGLSCCVSPCLARRLAWYVGHRVTPASSISHLQRYERGMQTGRERDWLYIVHVNTSKDKSRDSWKAPGPTMPDIDRALQGYSYDLVEVSGETAAHSLVRWVDESSIDVLVISAGRSRRLPNPMQSRTTDYIAANAACATLVIHPKVRLMIATVRMILVLILVTLLHTRTSPTRTGERTSLQYSLNLGTAVCCARNCPLYLTT